MLIRPLTADDAQAFHTVRLYGLQETPTCFASSYEEEKARALNDVAKVLIATDHSAVFGAFDDEDTLIGVAGVRRENLRKYHHKLALWGVYVMPSSRGAGVSKKLLREAIQFAATIPGARQMNLTVTQANLTALGLYHTLGFVEFGREANSLCVDGVMHDEIHMVLGLGTM